MEIIILGAGISGICMAIKLKRAGIDSFKIFEKSSGLGGTWFDNTYPGCACDVPSHFYSYSFELKANWSRVYSGSHEIREYLEYCANKYDVFSHIEFNTEIKSATFSPLYSLKFVFFIFTPIILIILKIPIREGFILTFLIFNLEFFVKIVRTIKKAHELMSEGIL